MFTLGLKRQLLLNQTYFLSPPTFKILASHTYITHRPFSIKENVTTSSFTSSTPSGEKVYKYAKNKFLSEPTDLAEPFVPKAEFTKNTFDPNLRQIPPEIPNKLMYRYLNTFIPKGDPLSAYVAVTHKNEVWHLFNAAKIPLGRMAQMISTFIRGKHKRDYSWNRFDLGDKCVVVNASKVKVTGNKLE